jgi:hypothetical protein
MLIHNQRVLHHLDDLILKTKKKRTPSAFDPWSVSLGMLYENQLAQGCLVVLASER